VDRLLRHLLGTIAATPSGGPRPPTKSSRRPTAKPFHTRPTGCATFVARNHRYRLPDPDVDAAAADNLSEAPGVRSWSLAGRRTCSELSVDCDDARLNRRLGEAGRCAPVWL